MPVGNKVSYIWIAGKIRLYLEAGATGVEAHMEDQKR